jgi:hypothetical protein
LNNYNNDIHQTFTIKEAGLKDYYTTLKNSNQHMILGVSVAIAGNYDAFTAASTQKCFVQNIDSNNLIGVLNKTQVYYIDPIHSATPAYLANELSSFYDLVGGFEGLLIQDSYMANQISGEVSQDSNKKPKQFQEVKGRMLDYGEESLGGYSPYQINET